MVLQKNLTASIDELVKDAEIFDIDALKRMYPDGLDRPCNAIIIVPIRLRVPGESQWVNMHRLV